MSRLIVDGGDFDGDGADGSGGDGDCSLDGTSCDTSGSEDDESGSGSPELPPPVRADRIYVNSGDGLYTFDPRTTAFEAVGPFVLEGGGVASVTDIAVDRSGLLYAVSQGAMYVCDPNTVVCDAIGHSSANSAGFASPGVLDPQREVLVVVEGSEVVHLRIDDGGVERFEAGSLATHSSSGDVAELSPGRMLLTSPGSGQDLLISFDARDGGDVEELGFGPPNIYGLAIFGGDIWGFDDAGQILRFDPELASFRPVARVEARLWGAAGHPNAR